MPQVGVAGTAQPGASVQLYLNGQSTGNPLAASASGTFSGQVTLAEGTHQLTARASNSRGQGPASSAVAVTYTPSVPTVVFVNPPEGAVLNANTTLEVSALDAGGIAKVGTRMGTGLAMAVDDSVNMVSLLRNMEEFFARESCGWCTPCRDGLPWSVKILRALERKQGTQQDIDTLLGLVNFLGPGKTFCAHAPGAVEPLGSAIKYFRPEFEAGVASSGAPAAAAQFAPA